MSTETIVRLKQERMNLAKQMHDMLDTATAENRGLTPEEKTRFDQLAADQESKKAEVERFAQDASLTRELGTVADSRSYATPQQRAVRSWLAGGAEALGDDRQHLTGKVRMGATVGALRGGESTAPVASTQAQEYMTFTGTEADIRAQTTSGQVGAATGTAGGDIIAPTFYRQIVDAMKYYGGMRQAPTTKLVTETGAVLQLPTNNDVTNVGRWIGENVQVTETDLTFGQDVLNAYISSSDLILVPVDLIQDSAFPLDAYIANKLGTRIGRLQNTAFTVGTGSTQPTGVMSGATLGATGATGKSGAFTYSDLITLLHSVDPAYRNQNTRWMMSDAAFAAAQQMVDGNGRPLWQPFASSGFGTGFPDTVLGYQVVLNQDVAAPAVAAKSVLFGDFSSYFIRDVQDIVVLRLVERYADYLQVGYIAFSRVDGITVDAGTHPLKYFVGGAS